MRSHLVLCLLLVPLGVSSASTQTAPVESWLAYDDARVRFHYPKDWNIRSWDDKVEKTRNWDVDMPIKNGEYAWLGSIRIIENYDGEEKRSLKEITAENTKGEYSLFHSSPSQVVIKGAECLAYVWEVAESVSVDGGLQEATAEMVCYKQNGNFVKGWTTLSFYPFERRGKLNEEAWRNAEVFDRFLKGLEFKP